MSTPMTKATSGTRLTGFKGIEAVRHLKLAPLAVIAPPIAWLTLFVARRIADAPFNEPASNVMIALLWIGGIVSLVGFVLSILALRARETESRPLSVVGAVLNFINLVFYVLIGLLAIFISV